MICWEKVTEAFLSLLKRPFLYRHYSFSLTLTFLNLSLTIAAVNFLQNILQSIFDAIKQLRLNDLHEHG